MEFLKRYITAVLVIALFSLSATYALFEWRNSAQDKNNYSELADFAVQQASNRFNDYLFRFTSSSAEYASAFEEGLTADSYDALNMYDFWGTVVFEEGTPVLWSGFTSPQLLDSTNRESTEVEVSISRDDNVMFIYSRIPVVITAQDTSLFQVLTTEKLTQENILSIGTDLELTASQLFNEPGEFPVRFSISEPAGPSVLAMKPVATISNDHAGYLYAIEDDIHSYWKETAQKSQTTRALFLLSILLVLSSFFVWVSRKLPALIQFIIQLSVLALLFFGYQLVNQFSIGLLSSIVTQPSVTILRNIGFTCLIGLACYSYISKRHILSSAAFESSHLFSGFFSGVLQALAFYYFFWSLHQVMLTESYSYLNEVFFSGWNSNILVLVSGVLFLVLLNLNYGLLRALSSYSYKVEAVPFFTNCLGYICSILAITFIASDHNHSLWFLGLTIVPHLISITWLLLQHRIRVKLVHVSTLRLFLVINFFFSASLLLLISLTYHNHIQDRMMEVISEFRNESDEEITAITRQLLSDLHFELMSLPNGNVDEIIQSTIQPEWLRYSISVQLIDTSGVLISDYTTNLSAPQWSTDFRIEELVIPFEGERIRRENLRPVLRNQPISTINAGYSLFRRGWIPLYRSVDTDSVKSWVLASVYNELPDQSRPLRAVINSTFDENPDYPISLIEYENLTPVRSSVFGVPSIIPDYSKLPLAIEQQVLKDSIFSVESEIQAKAVQELFVKKDQSSIIRAASVKPEAPQYLYAFLRIYFTLAIPVIVLLILLSGINKWNVLGDNRRFKDRLIDRFLVASFLCLFALVGVTFIILDRQNTVQVQDELLSRLNSFVQSIEVQDSTDFIDPEFLKATSSILEEDVALYLEANLVNSTTPQIYAQHILPDVLPWQVFQNLTENGSRQEIEFIELNDLEMLIGFQPWFSQENEIVGVAAIPTFLRTPKFYEDLLSTTSYLLGFFSLIFGALMISIGFIASRMTSPLEALNEGLQKISDGNLETKLPVTSKDEIGLLTQAYNTMASRLKNLQLELAQNEREAAWKEMAQQVAHEIKNPLTPMKLNLQHLERQLNETGGQLSEANPKIASITKSMIEQIEALNKIASDFSKFAKPLQQEFEVLNLNDLVESTADLYSQDNAIEVKLAPRKLLILGVQDELRRVLVNLIKNAQEASDQDGIIQLKTEADASQHVALIHVIDSGKGIPKEDHGRIFTPNFSTKTSGTGLGLAITRKIVEEHNGSISFKSSKNKGTIFTIKIPLKLK